MNGNRDLSMQRRPHLTKEQRLPKCFKEVEKVIRSVKSCKSNYKTILANSRLRGSVHKKVYSLTVNVLKNYNYIQRIIDKIQLLDKEQYLRREIASILIYEMIFGNGTLPGESKVVTTIQSYENDIRYAHEVLQNINSDNFITTDINIPRYVRVHTLVTKVPYVIKDLESCGFKQIFYDKDLPEEKYLELVKNLEKGSFLIDFHFKDILIFEHSENLIYLDLYKNGHIFLQDKASYIPVHVLNPEPGCAVLDACAAPGMKTVHIASKMKNKGILIACERDKTRFESLREMLDYGSVKICKALCKDFKLVDPNDQAFSSIEYILLDPSCSGSGMVSRMDEVTDTEDSKNKERLMKLAGFQIILLKHALKFPYVKRVVYSTCSIHEEENEYVVHEALNAFNDAFKLVPVMPEWPHRGSENFKYGKLCLRTVPEKHLTNGFFVAMFERVDKSEPTKGSHSSKNYNKSEVHVAEYETFTYGKFGSDSETQRKKSSELERRYKKKKMNETTEGFVDDDCYKHEDYSSKKTKHEYYKQQSIHYKENYNSQSCQKRDRRDKLDMLNKDVEGYENSNQNMINEQEQVNFDFCQEKNKKHKKKKKGSGECLYDCNEFRKELPNIPSKPQQKCSKLKENEDILFPKTSGGSTDVLTSKEKSKRNRHHGIENVSENVEITDNLADVTLIHKKKRKKKSEVGDNCSYETQMLQHENSVDTRASKQDKNKIACKFNTSHSVSSNCMQLESNENSFRDEYNGSNEILSVKRKKRKKHSKNTDFNNYSFVSNNDLSGPKCKSYHSYEKISENSTNIFQTQLKVPVDKFSKTEEYSGDKFSKHKKSKKHKHSDKSTNACDETINCAAVAEVNDVTDETVLPNPELMYVIQNDCVTVSKSKKCKSKKHKSEKNDDSLKLYDNNVNSSIPSTEVVGVDKIDMQHNEILLKVNSSRDEQVKKKKSKKEKKKKIQDNADYVNGSEIRVILSDEVISHQNNSNFSLISAVSNNCFENQKNDVGMGVKHEFHCLLSQCEEELEDILFSDSQPQKKKKKNKSESKKVSENVTATFM